MYGVELYANTGITHLSKLITLNKNLLRILQNKAHNAPVKELYTAYHVAHTTVAQTADALTGS